MINVKCQCLITIFLLAIELSFQPELRAYAKLCSNLKLWPQECQIIIETRILSYSAMCLSAQLMMSFPCTHKHTHTHSTRFAALASSSVSLQNDPALSTAFSIFGGAHAPPPMPSALMYIISIIRSAAEHPLTGVRQPAAHSRLRWKTLRGNVLPCAHLWAHTYTHSARRPSLGVNVRVPMRLLVDRAAYMCGATADITHHTCTHTHSQQEVRRCICINTNGSHSSKITKRCGVRVWNEEITVLRWSIYGAPATNYYWEPSSADTRAQAHTSAKAEPLTILMSVYSNAFEVSVFACVCLWYKPDHS